MLPLNSSSDPEVLARRALRQRLIEARHSFDATALASSAREALSIHLVRLLEELEPDCLGLYWPMRLEFNAPQALLADAKRLNWRLALPFTHREPRWMDYRQWNGAAPSLIDECRIPSSDGATVVPDVVLAPCVGFTDAGFRLGYGGGYFDRYLAAHPHVMAVGVAFGFMRLDPADYAPQPHDRPLDLIVTEDGAVRA